MAILKPTQSITYSLKEEVASRVMLLTRTVNPDLSTSFGATIHPFSITYEVDDSGVKTGIYEDKVLPEFQVSQDKLMQLFSIQVTLADGTVSYIGEILSNFADQLIAAHYAQPEDIITTQHINMDPPSVPPSVTS